MAKKELIKKAKKLGLEIPKRVTVKQLQEIIETVAPAEPEPAVDLVSCERELRKYVKCDGGFRKDISDADKKRAKEILKLLGRTKLEWDDKILPVNKKRKLV